MKDKLLNIASVSHSKKKWYAIYTKYKAEKYVCDNLEKKGIEAYIPLINKTRRYSKKIKHLKIPLINCYVFVHINTSQRVQVLETEYVYKFIKQGKIDESIPNEEILLLKHIVGEYNGNLLAQPNQWSTGTEVEIIRGGLTGMKGKLVDIKGKNLFVIELENIGYELQIEVDNKTIRPINKAV